jgi:hypothetical protein
LIRKQLTDKWKKQDIKENAEYSILTSEIAKASLGLTPKEHTTLKELEKQNLRDHRLGVQNPHALSLTATMLKGLTQTAKQ